MTDGRMERIWFVFLNRYPQHRATVIDDSYDVGDCWWAALLACQKQDELHSVGAGCRIWFCCALFNCYLQGGDNLRL